MSQKNFDPATAYDEVGPIDTTVRSGGYVMVRRPGQHPFVLGESDWRKLPKDPKEGPYYRIRKFRVFVYGQ